MKRLSIFGFIGSHMIDEVVAARRCTFSVEASPAAWTIGVAGLELRHQRRHRLASKLPSLSLFHPRQHQPAIRIWVWHRTTYSNQLPFTPLHIQTFLSIPLIAIVFEPAIMKGALF